MDTTMLASSVPDTNKKRVVMASKFKKAFTAKFGDKYKDNPKDSPAKEAAEKKAGKPT